MAQYVMAVDIGTSSARAIIFSLDGMVAGMSQAQYSVDMPKPGWQEQDPDTIWRGAVKAIRQCWENAAVRRENIAGMGLSSQMYSIFPIDRSGLPLMKSIIWADSRSEEQTEKLRDEYGARYFYERTACPLDSIYPLSKILWIKENYPDIFAKTYKFISIKEYIMQQLTGEYAADYSCASASGLLNVIKHCWEERALNALGITAGKLSEPLDVISIRKLNANGAAATGIPAGFPVMIGAGDGPLANLGSGAMNPGDINIDLGTSGAARTIVDQPILDPANRLWCYCLTTDKWALGGILNNVGNLYKWFADNVAFYGKPDNEEYLEIIGDYAASSVPGAKGAYFLPFLLKARSPYWDKNLRGMVYGLHPGHALPDISRAMIEGVSFNMMSIIQAIRENTSGIRRILFTGGLSKAAVWGQILADIIGERLELPVTKEGSAGGAAILAMYALGLKAGLEPLAANQSLGQFEPNPKNHHKYAKIYANYLKICEVTRQLSGVLKPVE